MLAFLAGERHACGRLGVIVSPVDRVADTVKVAPSASDGPSPPLASSVVFALVVGISAASVFGADPAGWFPFAVVKWWLVVVAVLVAAAVVLWNGSPVRTTVGVAFAVLLGLVTASGLWALDGRYAWFGTPVRHLGVAAWWLFGLAFVVGASIVGRNAGSRVRSAIPVARAMTVVGAALGAYVVWELLVARPIGYASDSQRLGGPFGSAAYLGAAYCLFVPIVLAVALDRRHDRRWRALATVASLGCGVGVIGSGSRAALMAVLAVGLVVAVVHRTSLVVRWRSRPVLAGTMVLVAVAVAVAGAVGLAVALAVKRGVFERSGGWSSRLDEWDLATNVIASRPVFGVGPEGYRIAAFELADDSYVALYGEETFVDRAHSGVLDVAATSGLVTAAAYVVVLALVLRAALVAVRRGSVVEVGLACSVIAYAVGQQLLFPIAEIDPLFWLLAGVVSTGVALERIARAPRLRRNERSLVRRGLALALLVASVAAAIVGVRHVAADRLSSTAVDTADPARAAELAQQARELAPSDVRHLLLVARTASGVGTLRGVDEAIIAIEDATTISPRDPAVRIEQARLLALRASITGTTADRSTARSAWADLVVDAPSCARCHLGVSLAAVERGDLDEAVGSLERAASLGNRDAARLLDRLAADR